MRWYKNLYMGKKAKKRKRKIMRSIKNGKPFPGSYVVTLPENNKNSLDIYPSLILLQNYYKNKDYYIIGIGFGRSETLEVVQEIVIDCYNKTGQFLVEKMIQSA